MTETERFSDHPVVPPDALALGRLTLVDPGARRGAHLHINCPLPAAAFDPDVEYDLIAGVQPAATIAADKYVAAAVGSADKAEIALKTEKFDSAG